MTEEKPEGSASPDRRDIEDRRTEKRREHERFVPSDADTSDRRRNERRRERE
jgi:hypothetical protein